LCNVDDIRGLHAAGDRTIQVPAGSSPSSSLLMEFGSSCVSDEKLQKKDFDMIDLN